MEKKLIDIEKEIRELISSIDTNKKSIEKLVDVQHTHETLEQILKSLIPTISELTSKTQSLKLSIDSIKYIIESQTTSTKVINLFSINSKNSYTILKKKGFGIIKELKISSKNKYDLYIKVDKTELLNNHASFDELKIISNGLKNITATEDNKINSITIKNIKFIEYIEVNINFNGNITIDNILCIYDIKEIL